jgi:heme exporter protein A
VASRGTTNVLSGGPPRAGATTAAVDLRAVTRVFGVTPAVVRVDLEVAPGEIVLIRGPNGAGKSTLLRIVATALSPTYGGGRVFGFDLVRERDEIRRRVELLGHRTRLYEDLTAEENLRFTCTMFGIDRAGVGPALGRVGLADVARERVRGFSQGMRQRVAVARVLLRAPEVLLLDEPYAGLDAEARDLVDRTVVEAQRDGRTVLLATHDASRAASVATRSVLMDGGRLVGEPRIAGVPGSPAAEELR